MKIFEKITVSIPYEKEEFFFTQLITVRRKFYSKVCESYHIVKDLVSSNNKSVYIHFLLFFRSMDMYRLYLDIPERKILADELNRFCGPVGEKVVVYKVEN